jgi:hypothetical protein
MGRIALLALLGAYHYVAFFYDSPAVHKKEKADISETISAGFDDNSAILPCSGIFVFMIICPSVKPPAKVFVITIVYTITPV